jgi:ribosome-associated protein
LAKTKQKNNISEELLTLIIDSLAEKKAKDIVSLDLRDIGVAVADWFVIAHGESNTQVNALHQFLIRSAKDAGFRAYHDEGKQNGEWIIVDFVDIVVHIFHRDKRDFYQLEELWSDAKKTIHDDAEAKATKVRKKTMKDMDATPYEDEASIILSKKPLRKTAYKGVKKSTAKPSTKTASSNTTTRPAKKIASQTKETSKKTTIVAKPTAKKAVSKTIKK